VPGEEIVAADAAALIDRNKDGDDHKKRMKDEG
jgi:hypothetical protein